MPSREAQPSAPATQPAPAAAGRILVLPFTAAAGTELPWLSHAIQQDIHSALSRTTRVPILAPAVQPALDTAAAIERGRQAGATEVVQGRYQLFAGEARLTGQVIDVAAGKSLGTFSAAGSVSNLFPLEDSATDQILHRLPATWVTVALRPATTQNSPDLTYSPPPTEQPPVVPPAAPTPVLPPLTYYSYTYPDYVPSGVPYPDYYGPYDDYPYYGYSIPYYGPDLWFGGGFDYYHHHHWDHWHGVHGGFFDHGAPHGFSHSPGFHSGGAHGGGAHGGGSHGGGGHRGR
jgi:TolB-like protein